MKYIGSKVKIAKEILPIILKDRKPNQYYVEPFVGGCNMIDKVDGLRIGGDLNPYLIAMWNGLKKNIERPKIISKELYSEYRDLFNRRVVRNENDYFMIGWIGFMASFNGRFFDGGYSGVAKGRNYIDEQIRNTEKQIPFILDVEFARSYYYNLAIPKESIIYCDIPYGNTKQYTFSRDFDHLIFWGWCRNMKDKGHAVFISSYNAPSDFKCVWEKEVTNSMNTKKTYHPIERLFTL